MGLRVSIYRERTLDDCSNGGVSSRVDELTVINVSGPSEPTPEQPAAILVNRDGHFYVEPEGPRPTGSVGPMMGGCYVATSDSRWSRAVGFYGAVSLHDRFETIAQYATYD